MFMGAAPWEPPGLVPTLTTSSKAATDTFDKELKNSCHAESLAGRSDPVAKKPVLTYGIRVDSQRLSTSAYV
jgi:hypothetical protein